MNRAPLLILVSLFSVACAEGLVPPEPTVMANVSTGLVFRFGMGQDGCDIPSPSQCEDTKAKKFDPGNPSVLIKLAPFAIDVHEVTNDQYRYCTAMGECSLNGGDNTVNISDYYAKPVEGGTVPNPKYGNFPVVLVNWLQAEEYCKFVGRRLPTEFEWERVAGGPSQSHADKQVYPFSDPGPQPAPPDCSAHNVNLYGCRFAPRPAEVGASGGDVVTVDGGQVWDMSGNVSEWTASPQNDFVACDMQGQPYECDECVTCLAEHPRLQCKPECEQCACGDGSLTSKPNCYKPCETPICPVYAPESQPIDPAKIVAAPSGQAVIRGGNFNEGSGQKAVAPCEGRSDYRAFTLPKGDPHLHIGFRCARTL